MTLLKASCDACAKLTMHMERYAGRSIFLGVRLKHGFRITEPPSHMPMIEGLSPSPEKAPQILVPTKNVPGTLLLLNPEPAGIFTDRPLGAKFNAEIFFRYILDGVNDTPEIRAGLGYPSNMYHEIKIDFIARLIAKIALGFGVAWCGHDGFSSTITNIVLGHDVSDWPHWIGGTTEAMVDFPPPSGANVLHKVGCFTEQIKGTWYLVVQIQLLSYLGTPIYTAVVGELNDLGRSRLHGDL